MKKILTFLAVGVVLVAAPGVALAQILPEDADTAIPYIGPDTPDNTVPIADPQDLIDVISIAIGWAQVFFWVLAVIMGLYAAFLYLTSSGSPDRVSQATKTLIWTAVAVAAAVISYALPIVVATFFDAA